MMRTRKDKTNIMIMLVALCMVGAAAVAGIVLCIHRETPVETLAEEVSPQDVDAIVLNTGEPEQPFIAPEVEDIRVNIDTDAQVSKDAGLTQEIQETPVKDDSEKPGEPPAESAKPDNGKQEQAPKQENASQNGQVKDGKIYIEGFGWIDYNGGGTEGVAADDMYENGNKVGIMD